MDIILIQAAGDLSDEACFLCASQAVDEGVVFHDPLAVIEDRLGLRLARTEDEAIEAGLVDEGAPFQGILRGCK